MIEARLPASALPIAPRPASLFHRAAPRGAARQPAPPALGPTPAATPPPHRRAVASAASPSSSAGSSSPNRQVRVSHILLPPGSEPQLAELRAQVESGAATLEALAAAHSSCPSRAKGGDVGWIPRGRTVAEFEAAAYSTPVGALAQCATQFGVHLLKVTAERGALEVGHCSVTELGEILAAAATDPETAAEMQFIDVREAWEVDTASLPGFRDTVLPLGSFQEWAPAVAAGARGGDGPLDPEKETYVLCHHGMRSMQVAQWLVETAGFKRVSNVTGGIDAYSQGVDPSVPRY